MRRIARVALALAPLMLASIPVGAEGPRVGQVLDRFFDAYRRGAVEEMVQTYAADAVFEDVNQRHRFVGSEELRGFLAGIVGLHTELDLREKRRVTVGDTVVVEYEYTGVLSGAALSQATGKEGCRDVEYVLPVTSWYEVENGHIRRQKDFIDLTTLQEIRQQAAGQSADAGQGS